MKFYLKNGIFPAINVNNLAAKNRTFYLRFWTVEAVVSSFFGQNRCKI